MAKTCRSLYEQLCSFENLELAFRKARKNKSLLPDVREFEFNLEKELFQLKHELETFIYKPKPLIHFVIRDPKTRVISASDFRDRVVHHALCNIIEPIFDKIFIYDSYANRKNKGNHAALQRFDYFKRKISQNGIKISQKDSNMVLGFALKCDIKHYFEEINHKILLDVLSRKINDRNIIWLIMKILGNHNCKVLGKGMPIGNLTSQFFANVYLNEFDYFVKHELRAKYYIRYVDDFIILHENREFLEYIMKRINQFLIEVLRLELHPDKSKIYSLHKGVRLLGFRCFYYFKIPTKSNIRNFELRIQNFMELYAYGDINKGEIFESIEGWNAYAMHGNTYKFRRSLMKKLHKSLERIDNSNDFKLQTC